nr:hypothetical protein [Tanacetum cinerariifolium]
PEIHHPSQADVEEVLHDREKFIQDTQTFLEKFNQFSFGFTLRVLTIDWERIDRIKYILTKPEEIPELMYKLREDVRNIREELAEYIDSPIWNCPTFFYDEDEEYTIQYREYLEESPDAVITILRTKEPAHSLSMGYEHLSTTFVTESDKVTESNVENLLPIPSKCEVTLEDEIECDMPAKDVCSPIFTIFSNPLFKEYDDFDSSDDESLSDEDVPAEEFKIYSNPLSDEDEINSDKLDPHCFNVESDFVESLLNRDTFIDFSSKFDFSEELNAEIIDTIIESIPLLPIPVHDGNSQQEEIDIVTETNDVLPPSDYNDDDLSNDSLLEEADLFLVSYNSIPSGIENVDPEGDVYFLEELLIDDSILSYESFDSRFEDKPSIPRPPPEPPDIESFFDLKLDVIAEEISDKLNKDKELNAEIVDTIIESIPLLPIPVHDGNSQQEEIDIVTETDDVLPPSDDNDDDLSNDSLLEEADLFLVSDNLIPSGIENVDPEGDVYFLEELLIDDSILSYESFDSSFEDKPSILRPPSEPPDIESFFDLKPDVIAEEISDKLNKDKCFEPGREINVSTKIEDDDYFPFMFIFHLS